MTIERTGTLVVGAGQAGIAMSEHLSGINEPHVVLERQRIAERWRTERWDSLVANGPAWHDRFPNMQFTDVAPDEFATRDQIVDYLSRYARMINAPIRCGVEVLHVNRCSGSRDFHVSTSAGEFYATNIVAATGAFQQPLIPAVVPESDTLVQLHSSEYLNPRQLPDGAVLVVGAGSSGTQIAEELLDAGRKVYLSVGPHDRPPRRYRGRDFVWWLGVLGKWDTQASAPAQQHVTIAVSGSNGGHTVDFRHMAARGMRLVGMTTSFDDGVMHFDTDLAGNLAAGDKNYLSVLDEADAYVERHGLDLPEEPDARSIWADPVCVSDPVTRLDLQHSGVSTLIWATGYTVSYDWLKADALDDNGRPIHQRGVASDRGIYFLGLPWQSGRGSSFIWGVWYDAKYIADHIATQRTYFDYHNASVNN